MQLQAILETCLYADDLDAAQQFYEHVLGLVLVSRQANRHVFFRCGRQMLLLFNPQQSTRVDGDVPPHGARGAGHVAFAATDEQLRHWAEQLHISGVPIERQVAWPRGGHSVYFRDPAGNSLEIATPQIWGLSETELPLRP